MSRLVVAWLAWLTILCDRLLRHESTDTKAPVLRHVPPWKGLKGGMEFVRDQKWGWQEGAAGEWLEAHG